MRVEPHAGVGALRAVPVPRAVHRDEPGDDPGAMLARDAIDVRGPDVLEEGRLGGVQLGHGPRRAPPHALTNRVS